jgi:sugar/nucleoside kinase (ribokinase family)
VTSPASRASRPPRVLVAGDIVTDVLAVHSAPMAIGSDTRARITLTGGGAAANTATWLAGEGVAVDFVAVAGADAAGADRLAELVAAGVSCAAVRRTPDAATGTIIVLAYADERTMISDRAASALLTADDIDAALDSAPDATHLHLSGYILLDPISRPAGVRALARAALAGLTSSVDAASAAPLRAVGGAAFLELVRDIDLLLANADEACALLDTAPTDGADALARRLSASVRHAVVKSGAAGAVWAHGGELLASAPAEPAEVVDPTGAGDAFAAGLLASWLRGGEPGGALRAGARLGAAAVSRVGARPTPRSA